MYEYHINSWLTTRPFWASDQNLSPSSVDVWRIMPTILHIWRHPVHDGCLIRRDPSWENKKIGLSQWGSWVAARRHLGKKRFPMGYSHVGVGRKERGEKGLTDNNNMCLGSPLLVLLCVSFVRAIHAYQGGRGIRPDESRVMNYSIRITTGKMRNRWEAQCLSL